MEGSDGSKRPCDDFLPWWLLRESEESERADIGAGDRSGEGRSPCCAAGGFACVGREKFWREPALEFEWAKKGDGGGGRA